MTTQLTDDQVRYSHLVDQTEQLRTHAFRNVKYNVELLEDALHALDNGSPEVTREFLTRTIHNLSKTRDRLKEQPDFD